MGFLVKGKTSIFVKEETTEGVYIAPLVTDAIEVLEDGFSVESSRDEIERNLLSDTIEVEASRLGMKQVSGSIPCEFKAGQTEGAYPKERVLYKSLLGGERQITTDTTTKTGNSANILQIQDADISKFNKHDIVLVKESGRYEARPILEVDDTLGAATITLAIPLTADPADNVVVSKCSTFYHADGAIPFSVTDYLGGKIKETVSGAKVISASLESWETGAVPTVNFSFEGLDHDREVENTPFVGDFSGDALPPVILGACIWMNQDKLQYNSFSLSMENTKAEILSGCSESGKVGARYTEFLTTGEVAPYMDDDNVDRFESFNLNESVSIFGYASNPAAAPGEIKNVVAFWLPQVKITAMPSGDEDGTMTDNITFKAHKNEGNDTVFLGFI